MYIFLFGSQNKYTIVVLSRGLLLPSRGKNTHCYSTGHIVAICYLSLKNSYLRWLLWSHGYETLSTPNPYYSWTAPRAWIETKPSPSPLYLACNL
jgi:non-ribosomal peptide synthetase component E (peptide arylation enzyme)